MIKTVEQVYKDDPGIDFANYSLEEEIKQYAGREPVGYNILIRLYKPPKVDRINNILLPDSLIDQLDQDHKFTNLVGLVIKMGADAYKDTIKFPNGPYCKVGDWVQFKRAAGHSFAHNLITSIYVYDDQIVDVVDDPRTTTRILV